MFTASSKPKEKSIGRVRLKIGEGVTGWAAKEKWPVHEEAYKISSALQNLLIS